MVQKLLNKAIDLEVAGETVIGPIHRACERHKLWPAPSLLNRITCGESLIVGDLLARGPLFPLKKRFGLPRAPTGENFRPIDVGNDGQPLPNRRR